MSDKKLAMLHEILAVEADVQGIVNRILPETTKTFSDKQAHFSASHKKLNLFGGDLTEEQTKAAEAAEEQIIEMVTTVGAKLEYTLDAVTRYWDVVLQKEATNQAATADLVLEDGTVIATGLPATFLLGLESKLKNLAAVYEAIPTLAPGIEWTLDELRGKGIYKQKHPLVRSKTAKKFQHQVLVQPTDKHPAQIEKWEDTVTVGSFTTNTWSSALTVTEKSELLGRLQQLSTAVKQARQRANATPVKKVNVGTSIVNFLHPAGF